MKKNLEYYRHYCQSHNHPKFKMLRLKYGWEGEGKFWALNNMIGLSEDCKLNIKKGYNKAIVASDLQFSLEEFEAYLQYLHKDCKLIIYKSGIISTELTQENYFKVHGDRVAAKIRKKKSKFTRENDELIKSSAELLKSSPEKTKKSNQIKPNKIKLNQTKINKTKPKEKIIFGEGRMDLITENQKQDQDQKLKPSLNGKTDLFFNKFWKFYNRREGDMMKVRQAFIENIRSEEDFSDLIKATRNYNNLTADKELKYIKYPINFLKTYKDFINIDN